MEYEPGVVREEAAVPEIRWDRLPLARDVPIAREWLLRQSAAGLSAATLDAYARAVERYLAWCRERRIQPAAATTGHVRAYRAELSAAGLRGATLLQRLVALRLFYGYVVERGLRPENPVAVGPAPVVGILEAARAESQPTPWVPREGEWLAILEAARAELRRSRLMLVLAYEGALRREELCALRRRDLDLRQGVLRVPAIGASREAARVVPLSAMAVAWCAAHVGEGPVRAGSADPEAPLFRSESPRNRAEPLSVWTWSKVARRVADRAGVAAFTTHTPRHLRLTDLARTGRGVAEIARFAGLSRPHLAHPYVRLAAESPWDADPGLAEARAGQFARTLFRDPP